MNIVIAGANGQIARLLHPILLGRGHQVRGLVRKQEQSAELNCTGVNTVVCDLEKTDDISTYLGERPELVLFAAGAGPGSGKARKWSVDRDGAVKLIRAAKNRGVKRYIMVSAMALDQPRGSEVFQTYQKAKAEADDALRNSGLSYTILKPGRLTDNPGTGLISLAPELSRGEIPRADVASTLAEVIEFPEVDGQTLDLISGNTPVDEAVRRYVGR
jgi:uncharacterized protein YbjT (DUF2867 family)